MSDEQAATIENAGTVCAAACDASGNCPTDVPAGMSNPDPECALQDQSGNQYCALECGLLGGDCPSSASCSGLFQGVCTYPSQSATDLKLSYKSEVEASSGTLALTFTDCGDASTHGTVKDIEPHSLTLGVSTDITGTGTLDEAAAGGAFVMKVSASGLIKQTLNGDICSSSSFDIKALGITVGTITWKGLTCPLAAGDVTVPLSAKLAASLPAALVHTTIALTATATSGDKLLCANIDLDKTGSVVV